MGKKLFPRHLWPEREKSLLEIGKNSIENVLYKNQNSFSERNRKDIGK